MLASAARSAEFGILTASEKATLRERVRSGLDATVEELNRVLRGEGVDRFETVLTRVGRGGRVPHWYEQLRDEHTLPNLDGKTIGSVVEMLFLAVLEGVTLASWFDGELRVNPARGVDFPDLDLGLKAPSENFCTSEPFTSPYERLIGSEYDAVVLLTDYQTQKKHPPLRLQVINWDYLRNTQIADRSLCTLAAKHREWLAREDESQAKRVCQFLAYVNQSDWRARHLLRILDVLDDRDAVSAAIDGAAVDFKAKNAARTRQDKVVIPAEELEKLRKIIEVEPRHIGVVAALDSWVVEHVAEFARLPSEREWTLFASGPLDGSIGMSFALQWRYNFGWLFGGRRAESEVDEVSLAVEGKEIVE